MTMKLGFWIVGSAAVAMAAAVGVAGCSSAPAHDAKDGNLGSVSLAMSAVGPDGATYTLSNQDFMNLSQGGALYFTSATGNQSFALQAGNYQATLYGGPTDGGPGWTLNRVADGGATTVAAALLDAQPYNFAITPGATTSLPLHFEVAGVGNVTFSVGTLTTSLVVDAGTFAAGHATATGTMNWSQSGAYTSSSTNATLNALTTIPSGQTAAVPYTLTGTITSPFTMGVDYSCAFITLATTATAAPDAGAVDNYAAWMQEVNGATGSICFSDAQSTGFTPNSVIINVTRNGAATTAPFQAAYPGAGAANFFIYAMATAPYLSNAGVLSLSSLANPITLPLEEFELGTSQGSNFVANFGYVGSFQLQITP
jgi:hypothetical protein